MIQIRNGIFETNSSSAHTVVMKKSGEYDYNLSWVNDGIYHITRPEEFGRSPFDILATTEEKIPYFIAVYGFSKIRQMIIDNVPSVKEVERPYLSRYDDREFFNDIDHQSIGVLENFIESHHITVEEALFNNRYIIIIDGDEYNVWFRLIDAGLIDKNSIEK